MAKRHFSQHAEEELHRRQIPREWIDALLDNPEQRLPQPGNKEILQSRMEALNGKMYLLRAIVATDKEPPVVVTIKIEKYWRAD